LCVGKLIHPVVHGPNVFSYLLGGPEYRDQKLKDKLITQVNEEKV
jgi:hypothetical protein